MTIVDLATYASANLPRYTSYPTAPHFGAMEEATWRAWLARMKPAEPLSLYVHIPFCHELCWYCGCHTTVTRSEERIGRYADALHREARLLALALPADGIVQHLHLGGGTPSALGAARLAALLGRLRTLFPFARHAELCIELDPRTLTEDVVATLEREGFSRASLGLQDANPEVQARIGRVQPEPTVRTAVERLRRAGIGSINLDVMYGLPGQTRAHVQATARLAAELGADRVAVFGYAHVPWMKAVQNAIRPEELPGPSERLEQAAEAAETLRDAGYVAIGLDHFARPGDSMARAAAAGRLRRNFQGYTTDDTGMLLGLGASAISMTPQGYAQNAPDEKGYVAAVEGGKLPVARGIALTPDDVIRRECIERVMCDLALDLDTLPAALLTAALPGLQALERDGILRLAGAWLTVPDEARPFLRHVAACFDARLGTGGGRHSAAV
jgi:oxygen-independent coproporphyrinogen-3 oxidase